MSEIGSDFYNADKTNTEFFLSGRTAEEFIIRDMMETHVIKSVLFPSLCCYTMIEPFIRHSIPVRFYDVIYNGKLRALLPKKRDCEALFYLDYFGYDRILGLETVDDWDITIEDCTHSWLYRTRSDADYSFVSYRKWTGLTAIAKAEKKNGKFLVKPDDIQNTFYVDYRKKAMDLKRKFLEQDVGYKEEYLRLFQQAEKLLEQDYIGYRPSYESLMQLLSLDVDTLKKKRRENAKVLYEGIKDVKQIRPLFSTMSDTDVPCHVPILVENGLRDELQRYLIDNKVYCPLHWPLTKSHAISVEAKKLYEKELSLICDQRYDKTHMEREVQLIRKFLEFRSK